MAWLGMYDWDAALQEANDVLWDALRSCLVGHGADAAVVPLRLSRPGEDKAAANAAAAAVGMVEAWADPRLCLAQTCGYPWVTALTGKAKLVATPIYDAPKCDCTDYAYRSLVVVKADSPYTTLGDLRGLRAAVNSWDSNSGMNAFRRLIAPLARGENESCADGGGGGDHDEASSSSARFFGEVRLSGGHLRSLAMVARGEADVAAIDCVTFSLLEDLRPELTAQVRVLAKTEASPGLPLITSALASASDVARLQSCLVEVFSPSHHDDDDEADINVREWQLPGVEMEEEEEDGEHAAAELALARLKQAKNLLRIKGIKVWTDEEEATKAYQKILDMEAEASAMGYAELE